MGKTKKIIILGILTTQALILSVIENRIPIPGALPGVKLGLANIIILIIIVFFNIKDALVVTIVKAVLSSIFAGGTTVFLFSIFGGIFSCLAMGFLYKRMFGFFSIVGISVLGAVIHNLAQLFMASFIMEDFSVMVYMPVLLLSALIMGSLTGISASYLIKAFEKNKIF